MAEKWGNKEEVNRNRRRFLDKLNIKIGDCVMASLELGIRVMRVGGKDKGMYVDGDVLITSETGVGLWMVTADCHATVVYDPAKKILALAHLGRQGLDGGLPGLVINKFRQLGSDTGEITVAAGPGVKKESYTWIGELPFKRDWGRFAEKTGEDGYLLDTGEFLKQQFIEAEITKQNIGVSEADVFSDRRFFSHVRSVKNGEPEGRFATVVMMNWLGN